MTKRPGFGGTLTSQTSGLGLDGILSLSFLYL